MFDTAIEFGLVSSGATINLVPCRKCSERYVLKDEAKNCDFCQIRMRSLVLAVA